MARNELVRQVKDVLATTTSSSTRYADGMVGTAIRLTASMTGKELTKAEFDYWLELLERQLPEATEWAFKEYLRTHKYFPMPADIVELVAAFNRNQKADQEAQERKKIQLARERGECVGIVEVLEKFNQVVAGKKFPAIAEGRHNQLKKKVEKYRANQDRRRQEGDAAQKSL